MTFVRDPSIQPRFLRQMQICLIGLITLTITSAPVRAAEFFRAVGSAYQTGKFSIPVNHSETIEVDQDYAELRIGSSEIADAVPLNERSFYLLGRSVGTTSLSMHDANNRVIGVIHVEVTLDTGFLTKKVREATGARQVRVTSTNGQIVLSGYVRDAKLAKRAVAVASEFAPGKVVNALSVTAAQQVMLQVQFIEASRDAGRELGIQYSGGRAVNDSRISGFRLGFGGLQTGSTPFGAILAGLVHNGTNIEVLISALEEKGLARRLAEPNLIALSGDTASFLAGGEFPIPVAVDDDRITIEFKEYGVGLEFTPIVLEDNIINLKIDPEVSQIDENTTIRLSDLEIPGLVVRRASTTIELRSGQSFAIAGLLQAESIRVLSQLPWLSSLPVIGSLLRSTSFQKRETDLVIIVTPHLVEPGVPGELLARPDRTTIAGNDIDLFLNGKPELLKRRKRAKDAFKQARKTRTFGHILTVSGEESPR